jgi:hypothetical protein
VVTPTVADDADAELLLPLTKFLTADSCTVGICQTTGTVAAKCKKTNDRTKIESKPL